MLITGAVPSMWRVELYHPMVVHLPLTLLLTATLLRVASLFRPPESFWKPAARLLLVGGVVGAWVAVYTGDLADAEVVRSLCDPTVVETHEELAFVTAGLFTGATVFEGVQWRAWGPDIVQKGLSWLLVALMLVGSGTLLYVGHLGASLVYQQGAGVYQPSQKCEEFAEYPGVDSADDSTVATQIRDLRPN